MRPLTDRARGELALQAGCAWRGKARRAGLRMLSILSEFT